MDMIVRSGIESFSRQKEGMTIFYAKPLYYAFSFFFFFR
jgi:hypothetical protein